MPVLFAEEKGKIRLLPDLNAVSAKEPENRVMDCHAAVAVEKVLIKQSMNNTTTDKIRKSLVKRQEALSRFKERREAYKLSKEMIIRDIEEARAIWISTLEQLPNQEFES